LRASLPGVRRAKKNRSAISEKCPTIPNYTANPEHATKENSHGDLRWDSFGHFTLYEWIEKIQKGKKG